MDGQYRKIEINEFVAGGKGQVVLRHILNEGELNGKCRMYAEVTLAPGCSIGDHPHHGETETYYILHGTGTYSDNGEKRPVQPGDITFCADGNTHGLENTGTEDLVFMALIING